eukprot:253082-Pyramimonas_sp.AAC.1
MMCAQVDPAVDNGEGCAVRWGAQVPSDYEKHSMTKDVVRYTSPDLEELKQELAVAQVYIFEDLSFNPTARFLPLQPPFSLPSAPLQTPSDTSRAKLLL